MRVVLLISVLALSAGCGAREELSVGEQCEQNSDCGNPLICQLGKCRRQCVASRDCAAGLRCLPVDADLGGACQLEEEATCALTSDCPPELICQMGTCATACTNDVDCLEGATCVITDGVSSCQEPTLELCIYNSDCPATPVELICDFDRVCREECINPLDCEPPRTCVDNRCVPPPGTTYCRTSDDCPMATPTCDDDPDTGSFTCM